MGDEAARLREILGTIVLTKIPQTQQVSIANSAHMNGPRTVALQASLRTD